MMMNFPTLTLLYYYMSSLLVFGTKRYSLAFVQVHSQKYLSTTKLVTSSCFLSTFRTIKSSRITNTMAFSTNQQTNDETTATSTTKLVDTSPSYKELIDKLVTITQLRRASAVLDYDRMVLMPSSDGAAAGRGAAQAALASVIHEKATDKSIPILIEKVKDELKNQCFSDDDKNHDSNHSNDNSIATMYKDEIRVLELTQKSYEQNERIPTELETKKAQLSSVAYTTWTKARSTNNFPLFAPTLQQCFDVAKEIAICHRGDQTHIPLYTQMLDQFEMGMKAERIDEIFHQIEQALVPLIAKVLSSSSSSSTGNNQPSSTGTCLNGTFDIEKQKQLNQDIVTSMGFDIQNGRMDVSVHPFTMSFSPSDVRITSRYSTTEWFQGMAASIHEAGHAMYEQNVGISGLDIDSYLSMGAHESQSLFWERHVGLSREFCEWILDKLKETYGGSEDNSFLKDCSAEDIYKAINTVTPSEIRVEADELTYPLHVILRYNIERDVVEGKLDVNDIPSKWKEMMKQMLNVDIVDDTKGCLQDVHWSGLAIGYFPTYLIGSATAAQLAFYCEKDIPTFRQDIKNGEFSKIKSWLVEKVHKHGRRYKSLDDMLKDQLGEELNPKYFINYLTEKYSDLYEI